METKPTTEPQPRVTWAGVLLLLQLVLLSAWGCGWRGWPLWLILLPTWVIPAGFVLGLIGILLLALIRVLLWPFRPKKQ